MKNQIKVHKILLFILLLSFILLLAANWYVKRLIKQYDVGPVTITNTPSLNVDKTETKPEAVSILQPKTEYKEITGLGDIFTNNSDIEKSDNESIIDLTFTGDVMLARYVEVLSNQKNDYEWMFSDTKSVFTSDLNIINLETPINNDCEIKTDGLIFCASSKYLKPLKNANINVVNIANNHAMDKGENGVKETIDLLNSSNFLVTGIPEPVYKTVKDTKFAFLGYSELTCNNKFIGCTNNSPKIINDIQLAKTNSDFVIVMYHFGTEYTYNPTTSQKQLSYLAIDNGADLVIGHHPHWYQPIELYKDKIIIYSHGNFIFDQMWSKETKQGIVSKFKILNNKVIDLDITPIEIVDYGRPYIPENNNIIKHLESISIPNN